MSNITTWNNPTTSPVPNGRVVWILLQEGGVDLGEYWPDLGWSSRYTGEKFSGVLGWRPAEECYCSSVSIPCQVCVDTWCAREEYENRFDVFTDPEAWHTPEAIRETMEEIHEIEREWRARQNK